MTRPHLVTDRPADVVAALSLEIGTVYTLEVSRSSASVVRLFEGGRRPPTDRSYFHSIGNGGKVEIIPFEDQPIWLWCAAGERAQVVVSEAQVIE